MPDHPFDTVFRELAAERFPGIRDALGDTDPWNRDAFVLVRPVVELLRDLRPDEGLGEEIGTMVSLVHAGFLYWMEGEQTLVVATETLAKVMADRSHAAEPRRTARYVRLPPRRIWGAALAGQAAEPFDGCFLVRTDDWLAVTAVLGFHEGREALTLVDVAGPRPPVLERADGSPLFAPVLEGGARAGLHSVLGMEELLELGWRLEALAHG